MKQNFLAALGLIGFLTLVGIVGGLESKYSRLATCTRRDGTIFTFTDNDGNDWEWEHDYKDFYEVGKAYRLIMDDNHSSSIYDDWIVKVKKY